MQSTDADTDPQHADDATLDPQLTSHDENTLPDETAEGINEGQGGGQALPSGEELRCLNQNATYYPDANSSVETDAASDGEAIGGPEVDPPAADATAAVEEPTAAKEGAAAAAADAAAEEVKAPNDAAQDAQGSIAPTADAASSAAAAAADAAAEEVAASSNAAHGVGKLADAAEVANSAARAAEEAEVRDNAAASLLTMNVGQPFVAYKTADQKLVQECGGLRFLEHTPCDGDSFFAAALLAFHERKMPSASVNELRQKSVHFACGDDDIDGLSAKEVRAGWGLTEGSCKSMVSEWCKKNRWMRSVQEELLADVLSFSTAALLGRPIAVLQRYCRSVTAALKEFEVSTMVAVYGQRSGDDLLHDDDSETNKLPVKRYLNFDDFCTRLKKGNKDNYIVLEFDHWLSSYEARYRGVPSLELQVLEAELGHKYPPSFNLDRIEVKMKTGARQEWKNFKAANAVTDALLEKLRDAKPRAIG